MGCTAPSTDGPIGSETMMHILHKYDKVLLLKFQSKGISIVAPRSSLL